MIEKYDNFNPEFKAIICNNIKVYRKEKGVRLMDLAEILDVSPEYLKRIDLVKQDNELTAKLIGMKNKCYSKVENDEAER